MFTQATVYRIAHWDRPPLAAIEQRLNERAFVACGATQTLSLGWVAPRGERHGALAESVAGQLVLALVVETRAVPASAVRDEVALRLDAIEAETGHRPRGKAARDLKDDVVHALLPRAFSRRRTLHVWVDAEGGYVWIDVAAAKPLDAALTLLADALGGGLRLAPLQTVDAPAAAMADWLVQQQAPSGFTIDRDCTLAQPDGERATVRYARHALDAADVAAHVRAGKRPTQLALTWASRVSFVVADTLVLKRIRRVDAVVDDASEAAAGGDDFDADVALVTGELAPLLAALVDAFGGVADDAADASAGGQISPAASARK